jgi:predicted heme/steroid binding protein
MSEKYTTADVTKHKDDANGYWIIVEGDVYDVSSTCCIRNRPHPSNSPSHGSSTLP